MTRIALEITWRAKATKGVNATIGGSNEYRLRILYLSNTARNITGIKSTATSKVKT